MRTAAVTLVCLLLLSLSRRCLAEGVPQSPPPPDPRQQYALRDKSPALALTLELICPLAGAGVLYARDTDKALVLGGLSILALGAGAGSAYALLHFGNQHPTGTDRVILDVEQGAAVTVLVGAVVSYLILRISGLVLAPRAVAAFNADLQQQLGIPPAEPVLPAHALAPGVNLKLRF